MNSVSKITFLSTDMALWYQEHGASENTDGAMTLSSQKCKSLGTMSSDREGMDRHTWLDGSKPYFLASARDPVKSLTTKAKKTGYEIVAWEWQIKYK